jgi:predicted nucleotidyltransferase
MSNNLKEIKKLKSIFKSYPEIKLVYFFGSRAAGKESSLSDYDFAVYLDTKDKKAMYEIRFELFSAISILLKTDKIDIVILNLTEAPELKYCIIKEGSLIFERKPFKVLVEPNILNEYFDFQIGLLKYNLTQA